MFQPDYRNLVEAACHRRPVRMPFYDHAVAPEVIEAIDGVSLQGLQEGDEADLREFFRRYAGFFLRHEYDTVSFECGVCGILPGGGALVGHETPSIGNRAAFESYPWERLPELYWERYERCFAALSEALPPGMKVVGGVGYGIFEIVQDLTGYENLCLMQMDEPELFAALFQRVGELHLTLWRELLKRHGDDFAVCRIGDDMGYRTSTLLAPEIFLQHSIPHYRKIISLIHAAGKPFLLHSCGKIFPIMDALIEEAGIDAKHSNEDAIAPFDEWIDRYGDRIGLFGGIDVDVICRSTPEEVYAYVLDHGTRYRQRISGYAMGTGNSVPAYMPAEGFLAMNRAGREIRRREAGGQVEK